MCGVQVQTVSVTPTTPRNHLPYMELLSHHSPQKHARFPCSACAAASAAYDMFHVCVCVCDAFSLSLVNIYILYVRVVQTSCPMWNGRKSSIRTRIAFMHNQI